MLFVKKFLGGDDESGRSRNASGTSTPASGRPIGGASMASMSATSLLSPSRFGAGTSRGSSPDASRRSVSPSKLTSSSFLSDFSPSNLFNTFSKQMDVHDDDVGSNSSSIIPSSSEDSPVTPPEPDLSHLTDEERLQIARVLAKARLADIEEDERLRQLEQQIETTEDAASRQTSTLDVREEDDSNKCPMCSENNVDPTKKDYTCADCGRLVCYDCGNFSSEPGTKFAEWMCIICQKKRYLTASSGGWFHGLRHQPISLQSLLKAAPSKKVERTQSFRFHEEPELSENLHDKNRRSSVPNKSFGEYTGVRRSPILAKRSDGEDYMQTDEHDGYEERHQRYGQYLSSPSSTHGDTSINTSQSSHYPDTTTSEVTLSVPTTSRTSVSEDASPQQSQPVTVVKAKKKDVEQLFDDTNTKSSRSQLKRQAHSCDTEYIPEAKTRSNERTHSNRSDPGVMEKASKVTKKKPQPLTHPDMITGHVFSPPNSPRRRKMLESPPHSPPIRRNSFPEYYGLSPPCSPLDTAEALFAQPYTERDIPEGSYQHNWPYELPKAMHSPDKLNEKLHNTPPTMNTQPIPVIQQSTEPITTPSKIAMDVAKFAATIASSTEFMTNDPVVSPVSKESQHHFQFPIKSSSIASSPSSSSTGSPSATIKVISPSFVSSSPQLKSFSLSQESPPPPSIIQPHHPPQNQQIQPERQDSGKSLPDIPENQILTNEAIHIAQKQSESFEEKELQQLYQNRDVINDYEIDELEFDQRLASPEMADGRRSESPEYYDEDEYFVNENMGTIQRAPHNIHSVLIEQKEQHKLLKPQNSNEWSSKDLSPIEDVSPSVELIEAEQMQSFSFAKQKQINKPPLMVLDSNVRITVQETKIKSTEIHPYQQEQKRAKSSTDKLKATMTTTVPISTLPDDVTEASIRSPPRVGPAGSVHRSSPQTIPMATNEDKLNRPRNRPQMPTET